jgi:hypothetical protein
MVIRIVDIVSGADTADQGLAVHEVIRRALKSGGQVEVSFEVIKTATSSFANAAFAQLLSDFSLEEIKNRISVVQSTRQINDMIKICVERKSAAEKA